MVMCASAPEKVEILDPPPSCVPGDMVRFEGYTGVSCVIASTHTHTHTHTGEPDAQLNPKKKVFEQVQPDLLVNEEGVATYRGIPFAVAAKGICQAATMRGSGIK